jgi:hypothetical protein
MLEFDASPNLQDERCLLLEHLDPDIFGWCCEYVYTGNYTFIFPPGQESTQKQSIRLQDFGFDGPFAVVVPHIRSKGFIALTWPTLLTILESIPLQASTSGSSCVCFLSRNSGILFQTYVSPIVLPMNHSGILWKRLDHTFLWERHPIDIKIMECAAIRTRGVL